jgi:hypothetical protein
VVRLHDSGKRQTRTDMGVSGRRWPCIAISLCRLFAVVLRCGKNQNTVDSGVLAVEHQSTEVLVGNSPVSHGDDTSPIADDLQIIRNRFAG